MYLRLIFCALIMLPLSLAAQYQTSAQPKNWQVVSSEHFDVYHQRADEVSAQLVAKLAEQARHEVLILFDVRPKARYSLVFMPSQVDLINSNLELVQPENGPGLFMLPAHRAVVVHPGTTSGLYDNIKKEVTGFLMSEFAYGNRIGSSLQTQLLFNNAPWFKDGLKEYVSEGWTFKDEMWINSLNSQELLSIALEGDGELHRTVRKSIWYFIAHEYGDQKLSEIVYLVKVSNSIESGIVSVLGITLNTLTARWRDYIETRAETQRQRRVDLSGWTDVTDIQLPQGYELVSFVWNTNTEQIAAWMQKEGQFRLFIYGSEGRSWETTPLKMGLQSMQTAGIDLHEIPLSWNSDGSKLVTSISGPRAEKQLVYYTVSNRDTDYEALGSGLQNIFDLAWSHDGKSVAATILREGQIDLFTTRAGEANFRAITNDAFDERDPAWSLDDTRIFFASNRDSAGLDDNRQPWLLTNALFDIYSVDRSDDNRLERITQTAFSDERKPMPISSFQIKYLTDESGIWNLHLMNIFLKEQEAITNTDLGVNAWSGDEESVLLSSPYSGKMHLFRVETELLTAPPTPELTLLRLEYIAAFQAQQRKLKREEEIAQAVAEPEPILPVESTPTPAEQEIAEETVVEIEEDEPVRYYIFDEEDQPYDIKRPERTETNTSPTQPRRWSTRTTTRKTQEAPNLDELDISGATVAKNSFAAEYLNLGFTFDPLARFGMDLGVGFSDILNHHKIDVSIQPFVANSFYNARYTYQPGRIDWYGEVGYINRQFRHQTQLLSDSLLFRYNQARIEGGMILPITSKTALNVKGGWHMLNRLDQQVRRSELLDASDQVAIIGARLAHRDVTYTEQYRIKGWEANLNWDSYYSLSQKQFAFHRLSGEARHYLPVYKQIVLASKIGASFTLPNEITQAYLGGVNDQLFLFALENTEQTSVAANAVDTSLYSFHYQQFVTAVRGFRPITRDGSRYLSGNFELRIPISRMMRHGLNSNSLYNLELIPFFDVGAVWTEGNPFSQKKPTDTRIITSGNVTIRLQTLKSPFLMGFGSGLRMNILGYSLRGDLAWGVDDQSLTAPMIMVSVGKNF